MKTRRWRMEDGGWTARSVLECGSALRLWEGIGAPHAVQSARALAQSKTCRPTGARDSSRPGSADFQSAVSRVSNLRGHRSFRTRWHSPAPADWKSATRQVGNLRYSFALLALLLLATLIPQLSTAHAQQFSIPWHTLDGGGGTSTGGVFTVSGTIGQPDAGRMSGGNFSIDGGFWGLIAAVQTPGAPLLTIFRTTTNTVAVTWTSPSTGWRLQQNTNSISSVNWSNAPGTIQDNGTIKTLIVNPPSGNRFYRLFRQ